jgi:hypothetical protein
MFQVSTLPRALSATATPTADLMLLANRELGAPLTGPSPKNRHARSLIPSLVRCPGLLLGRARPSLAHALDQRRPAST